jgi:hypothetical protein
MQLRVAEIEVHAPMKLPVGYTSWLSVGNLRGTDAGAAWTKEGSQCLTSDVQMRRVAKTSLQANGSESP